MAELVTLLHKNRDWAMRMTSRDPDFFQRLAEQHSPEYLWIGCSDSRVCVAGCAELDGTYQAALQRLNCEPYQPRASAQCATHLTCREE